MVQGAEGDSPAIVSVRASREGKRLGVPDDDGLDGLRCVMDVEHAAGGDPTDRAAGVVDPSLEVEVVGAVVGQAGQVEVGAQERVDAACSPECDEAALAGEGAFEHPVEVGGLVRGLVEQKDLSQGGLVGHALRSVSG